MGSGGVKIPSDECVEELKNGRVPGPQISGEIAGEDEDVAVEAGAKGLQEILERGRLVEGFSTRDGDAVCRQQGSAYREVAPNPPWACLLVRWRQCLKRTRLSASLTASSMRGFRTSSGGSRNTGRVMWFRASTFCVRASTRSISSVPASK